MLYIHVGQVERECIRTIDPYFNRNKSKDWFNRDDVKRIIKNIDLSVAVKDEYIESPVFGGMSPTKLSTGCKAVILMAVLESEKKICTFGGFVDEYYRIRDNF